MMAFLLGLTFLFAADIPTNLKGDWQIQAVLAGKRNLTAGDKGPVLKIRDDSVEWNDEIPFFEEKSRKAKFAAKGKRNGGELELKIGDKVYKGLYLIKEDKEDKKVRLKILLGPEGKAAPKAFPKDAGLPSDAAFMFECVRKG